MEEQSTQDPRVNLAIQEYLERIDRGEKVDRATFLRQHADVAAALESFLASDDELARRAAVSATPTAEVSTNRSISETIAPVSSEGTPALPEVFGRYRVRRLLGRGAMGAVYLAQDTQLSRQVALKVPSFTGAPTDELFQRFYREARAAGTLRSTNICPVYDVGEIDGQHYISMAYIEGHSLSEVIKIHGPQPVRNVLVLVRKVALALQEAHEKGIVHRDLKPGNVMVDRRGEPVVMDFGLASHTREDAARLTQSGVIIGSPAYMPPEQVEGDQARVSGASDQYALGVMLYELLTGELPFRGSIPVVVSQVLTKPAPSPRLLQPDLDPRVDALCLRMMSKNREDRFPSMKAVADQVLAILKDPALAESPAKATTDAKAESKPAPEKRVRAKENPARKDTAEANKEVSVEFEIEADDSAELTDSALGQSVPKLCLVAGKLIRKHDYAEARRLLASVPSNSRTDELNVLLSLAEEKDDESTNLLQEIKQAIEQSQPDELPRLVKRFLQLKPANKLVRKLADDLKEFGPERAIRLHQGRIHEFDPAGRVWNPAHVVAYCVGLAALCAAVYLTAIAFQTPRGTVIIEVHDPRVSVEFSNDEITATSSGKKYRIKTTDKKTLQFEVDGVTVDSATQEITVAQDEIKLITARLVDGELSLEIDSQRKAFPIFPKEANPTQKVASKTSGLPRANPSEWVDLLALVDPAKASGTLQRWSREEFGLKAVLKESAESGWMGLVFPQEASGDLDLEVECLVVDSDYLSVSFPLNDTAAALSIGNLGTALHWIDGKDVDWKKVSRPHGNPELSLKPGHKHRIEVSVRHDGENVSVETKFDGADAGRFSGARSRVSIPKEAIPAFNRFKIVSPLHKKTLNGRLEVHTARARFLKSPASSPSAAPPPADAVAFGGHAYKFFAEKISWSEAKRRCEALGGHLPIVDDQAENDFLAQLGQGKVPASDKLGGATLWLGASDAEKEGDWRSLDGSPLKFTNWYGKQPNNGSNGDEHFATLLLMNLPKVKAKLGQWSDQPDSSTQQDVYFACEWDSLPPNATAGAPQKPAPAEPSTAGPPRNVILDVDFRQGDGGFRLADEHHILAEHKGGEYRYLGKKVGWWYNALHPSFWTTENNHLREFFLEVDLRIVSQKKGAFAIEFGRAGGSTLSLCIDQNARVKLLQGFEEIVPPTGSPALRPPDQFNTYGLTVQDNAVQVAVNGKPLFEKKLDRIGGAPLCLWLVPDEVPFDVRLQRLHIEKRGDGKPRIVTPEVRRLRGHPDIVRAIAFLPDSRRAVSVGHGQTFKLWDVTTGELLHDFVGHGENVTSVAVSGDGSRALTGCDDMQVRLWDLNNRTLLKTLKGHAAHVSSVQISRDGNVGLSVSVDGNLRQWDLKSGKPKVLTGPPAGNVLAMSLDDKVVATGRTDGTILLRNRQGFGTLTGHEPGLIDGLAFSPDGTRLVTGADDGTVRLWDLQTGKAVHRFDDGGVGFDSVTVTNDGRYVIAGSNDQTIICWDLETGDKVLTIQADVPVTHRLALSPDNQFILSGGGDQAWKAIGDYDLHLWKLPQPPAPP